MGEVMIIVAGHIVVEQGGRDAYLAGCIGAVEQARRAPGCLEFSVTADLIDPSRVVVFERWDSPATLADFRGSGPDDEQAASILSASVTEYTVTEGNSLT